ncbi:YcjX family protein [soil metagenome]
MKLAHLIDGTRLAVGGMKDFATGFADPALRIGVTGLARSGKTVFITAVIQALLKDARLPLFDAHAQGRIRRAYLEPQPDDDLPRFSFEDHIAALTAKDRKWPESTRRLSQIRLTIDYTPIGLFARNFGSGRLHVDIVDYPGEWLLDLPLMSKSYAGWSAETVAASRKAPRLALAAGWHAHLTGLDPAAKADEADAVKAAELFTAYLARCRASDISLSSLPPGRFLMPGDLEGSPLLTFAPLDIDPGASIASGSLAALMARRYDSYVSRIVKPFFFGHFARLDRQIVLVDVLSALNAGADAVGDLRTALTDVLACFRQGANSWTSALFGRRINRILFAAAKADLLHHTSHDRLEAILRVLIEDAASRAEFSGAAIDVAALSAIRATREASVRRKGEDLPCIVGVPQRGETIADETFDGNTEAAIFPGDLPANPQLALEGGLEGALRFVKFRPPAVKGEPFPHIRLDRALEFLLGDRFA